MEPAVAHKITNEVVPADHDIMTAAGFPDQQQSFIVVASFKGALNMLGDIEVVVEEFEMLLHLPSDCSLLLVRESWRERVLDPGRCSSRCDLSNAQRSGGQDTEGSLCLRRNT